MIIFNSGNNKIYLNLFDKIVYEQSDILFTIKNSLTKVSKDLYPTIVSTSNKYYEFSIDLVDANQENLTGGTINLQTGYYDIYVKNYSGNNETIILEERGRVIGPGKTINNIQTVNTNNLQFPEDSFCDRVSNCDVVKGKLNTSDFNNYSANTNNTLTGITNTLNNKVSKSGDNISYLDFDLTGGTNSVGRLVWNDVDGTLDLGLKGGNVTLQLGQEQVVRGVNKTGANLLESQYRVIRLNGAQGNRVEFALAQANTSISSSETIGLVTENINNNQEGFITTFGLVRNINTTGSLQGETWLDGDILYLSTSTPGGLTKVIPTYPNKVVVVGYVIRAHNNQGKIFVKVDVKTNKDDIGLGNVDNTSDVNKPISTATQTQLNNKFDKSGGTITGIVNLQTLSGTTAPLAVSGGTIYAVNRSGTFANRPTSPFVGQIYFATDLGSSGTLLTWDGTNWRGRVIYTSGNNQAIGNTTSLSVIASVNIPAGLLTTNSRIEVSSFYNATLTAAQTWGIRSYMTPTSATDTTGTFEFNRLLSLTNTQRQVGSVKTISNQNSLSSQRYYMQIFANISYESVNTIDPATTILSVNTANQFWINFAAIKSLATDLVVLNHYLIDIIL